MKELIKGQTVVIRQHSTGWNRIQKLFLFAEVLEVGKVKIKTTLGDFKTRNGDKWGESTYHCDSICDVDVEKAKEKNKEIVLSNKKLRLCSKFQSSIDWSNYTLEQLEQIDAIVDPNPEQAAE